MTKKSLGKGLGKGLGALLPTIESEEVTSTAKKGVEEIDINQINPNSKQPRRVFDDEKLNELALSIKEHGVVQPIIVRKVGDHYEIVAGERRWRACQLLGLKTIPAVVKEYTDEEVTEIALIENIQRENLNPVEEALAYKQLIEKFKFTQEKVAVKLGKSRPYVTNLLRILNLPQKVLDMMQEGILTLGHGRTLLALSSAKQQEEVAEKILQLSLSVRQTEELVKKLTEGKVEKPDSSKTSPKIDPAYRQIEDRLRSIFGTKVKISNKGSKGKIEIEYYSEDELNRILDLVIGPDGL